MRGSSGGGAAILGLVLHGLVTPGVSADAAPRAFEESADALGLRFTHNHFGTGEKFMPENMGPGVVLFDADGDGLLDVYFLQGAPIPPAAELVPPGNRLFRQTESGSFVDVTERAGVGDTGYGMGASFGDIDADGDPDLFVTNFGRNTLLVNRGDGSFEDRTGEAGLGGHSWGTSSGFADVDGDADLDLFVVNYVDFAFDNHKWCGNVEERVRSYCHPDVYDGLPDRLYRNAGGGRFEDISAVGGIDAGTEGKGLGVVMADFDDDGHMDIFVANDSTKNHLYLGEGTGAFAETALLSGVGYNGAGAPEASMGVAFGDVDGDGRPDLFLTHLDEETNTLYLNQGGGLFADRTNAAGLALPSQPWVGFGTVLLDHDADGDLDVFVTNGHIIDNIREFDASRSYRQPSQLFENDGGRFVERSETLGLREPLVGRGAASGDLDRDGDPDLVLAQNNGPALVLRNTLDEPERSLWVELRGRGGNSRGFGAVLTLNADAPLVRHLLSSSSYLSQGEPAVHFGLGDAAGGTLRVDWPRRKAVRYLGLRGGRRYVVYE